MELLALGDDLLDDVAVALVLAFLDRCLLLLPVGSDRTVDLVLVLANTFFGGLLETFQGSLEYFSLLKGSHQNEQVLHVVLKFLIDSFRSHFVGVGRQPLLLLDSSVSELLVEQRDLLAYLSDVVPAQSLHVLDNAFDFGKELV